MRDLVVDLAPVVALAVACALGVWWWWQEWQEWQQRRSPSKWRRDDPWAELLPRLTGVSGVWYSDEASHTGDLVFFVPCAETVSAGMVVMHPATGEPWIVEAADSHRVTALPLRTRLDTEGMAIIVPIVDPLSAADVHVAMVTERDGGATGTQFMARVLARLRVVAASAGSAYDLLHAAGASGKYDAPVLLR